MDSGIGKITRKLSLAVVMLAALVLAMGMPGQASAAQTCAGIGGTDVGGDCTISTPVTAFCPIDLDVPGDLVITGAGSISCNDTGVPATGASPITIRVVGDMEMQGGSFIRAENLSGGGDGGKIMLTVAGSFLMKSGAVISSSNTGSGTGAAGDIRIKVGNSTVNADELTITCDVAPSGDIVVENGANILANALSEAGSIKMFAGKNATINGLVSSEGTLTTGRGGPITIDACCDLVIGDTGQVISRGKDPGADLVHLQACVVKIWGLVASTGPGHGPIPFANLCNVNRPGKPADSAACVEIWAGTTLEIDSTGTHKGEVNADTAQSGGPQGSSWIDVLANLAITIRGNTLAPAAADNNDTSPAYAVHANQAAQNGHGGTITVISTTGAVTMSGRALQANASTVSNGGKGGHVVILAHDVVAFGAAGVPAFVQAAGDITGGLPQGGTVLAQSFNLIGGNVTGLAGSQINVAGPNGTATLRGCVDPTGTYLGTVIGTEVDQTVCPGGSPPLPTPANTLIPSAAFCTSNSCVPLQAGNKTGVKFLDSNQNHKQDAGEPGLIGWSIHVFNTATKALVASTFTLAANPVSIPPTPDGFYSFTLPLPGNYTVCEGLQPGWTQTAPSVFFPVPIGETLADCTTYTNGGLITPGPTGYNFTIVGAEIHAGNDFGNFQPGVCPEDPLRASKITRVVDETGTSHGPPPVYLTVQDAYTAAGGPNEVIGLFSKTTENVVLNGNKALTITQCTNARVFALDPTLPVWTIGSSKPLLIIGPDAVGGKVGWQINTSGHDLKGLRANGASLYGIQVVGPNNKVAWNSVSGNGGAVDSAGIRVESSGNNLRGGTVSGNTGDGVQIVGNTNILNGATVQSNTGNGVFISGTNNTIKSNKANKNGGAGFLTTATGTGNKFSSNASNTSAQGGAKANGATQYNFATPEVNLGSNKADNVTISAAKCPTLFSLGGTCD